ncbi:YbbR-like domain-containing protein [Streptococcus sp. sy010]|uniref:CdaR family protein n=1 Tax=Streptococcus sp. sy010 TaxID=2600148 RepID=UPI0011B76F2B|nr:CdaR family protein [Streptococcus sp. sy010]TWT16613.1 YbbR-like domain-containing protein [Streptococcus sp. sy010]
MLRRFFQTKFSMVLLSLVLSFLLFLTATSVRYSNKVNTTKESAETYTYTIEHVPIDIQYDNSKYFIVGYSYDAEVYLTATNRVKLDSEINSDTRKFKVMADLTNVKEGTSKVELKVRNLPSGMTAKVIPASMSVTLGLKKTKTFNVEVDMDSINLAQGYRLLDVDIADKKVEVTSDENTIDQVSRVIAKLPEDVTLSEKYSGAVTLQAVAADGTVLPSIIEPSKSKLTVNVEAITKTVPIKVELSGKMEESLSNVLYKLTEEQVTIQGSQEQLDTINEITTKVDITGVNKEVIQMTSLQVPEGITASISQVEVKLSPVKK